MYLENGKDEISASLLQSYLLLKNIYIYIFTWKDIIKYLQKYEGCTHFCEILYIKQFNASLLNKCINYKDSSEQ